MAQLGDLVLAGMNRDQVDRHLRPFLTPSGPVKKQVQIEVRNEVPVARASPGVKKQIITAGKPMAVAKPTPIVKPTVISQPTIVISQPNVVEKPDETVVEIDQTLPELEENVI